MVLRADLLSLLRNGEGSGVEFKLDSLENRALAKELVALANFEGGVVLLGMDDSGRVEGITRPDLEEWVMTTCRDKIRPALIPYYEVIRDAEPGKDVAVVRLTRGWGVHAVWHHNHSTYYIRVGSQSREATHEELERLFQQRGGMRAELRPVSGTSLADLDMRRLTDYFARVRRQETPAADELDLWTSLLLNTEFLCEDGDSVPCTLAGIVLFGLQPYRTLPQAGIDAAAYPGEEKDYGTLEREQIRGPLTALDRSGGLEEPGVVERGLAFLDRNTRTDASIDASGRRAERLEYPREAVREALVNALVHRDYLLSGTTTELSLYSDRLEIVSAGRLPNGITPERMRAGTRTSRNQLITDVMRDYGYLEHMGMGVPRKIVQGMREHNGTEPGFTESGERFTVTLLGGRPTHSPPPAFPATGPPPVGGFAIRHQRPEERPDQYLSHPQRRRDRL